MTCKELIMSIVDADDQNGYSMEIDDAEYPTINALRIRKCREKETQK